MLGIGRIERAAIWIAISTTAFISSGAWRSKAWSVSPSRIPWSIRLLLAGLTHVVDHAHVRIFSAEADRASLRKR